MPSHKICFRWIVSRVVYWYLVIILNCVIAKRGFLHFKRQISQAIHYAAAAVVAATMGDVWNELKTESEFELSKHPANQWNNGNEGILSDRRQQTTDTYIYRQISQSPPYASMESNVMHPLVSNHLSFPQCIRICINNNIDAMSCEMIEHVTQFVACKIQTDA